jgi:hypothetical protein
MLDRNEAFGVELGYECNRLKDAIELAKKGESPHLTYFVSSGGLKATAWRNRYRQIEAINLEFVLTDWQSDGDC